MTATVRNAAFLAAVLLAAACEKKEAPQPAPGAPPASTAAPGAPASPPAEAAPAPTGTEAAPAPSAPAAASGPTARSAPKPTPAPTPTPKPTAPAATTPPAGAPPAAPTAATTPPPATPPAGHAKVGPEKCKMCHRLQYDSWAASPHKAKGLECEGCHGNGGDYWPAAVMRDRAKATAAGLVIPDLAACRKCHGAKADAALYAKVHAHKAK